MMSVRGIIREVGQNEKPADAPSGPMLVSLTPLEVINSRALFTFSAFWTRMRGALL